MYLSNLLCINQAHYKHMIVYTYIFLPVASALYQLLLLNNFLNLLFLFFCVPQDDSDTWNQGTVQLLDYIPPETLSPSFILIMTQFSYMGL